MTLDPAVQAELSRLIAVCCDDEPTEAERLQLNELLRNDVECRRLYLQYVDLHSALLQRPPVSFLAPAPQPEPALELIALPDAREAAPAGGMSRGASLAILFAAAAIILLSCFYWVRMFTDDGRPVVVAPNVPAPDGPLAPQPTNSKAIATIVESEGAVWADSVERDVGRQLSRSNFHLRSGDVTLQFEAGEILSVRGPAFFSISNGHTATLIGGTAVLSSGESIEPFVLMTPFSRWVDERADYTITVGPNYDELHVRNGKVLRTARSTLLDPLPEVWLTRDQSRRFLEDGDPFGIPVPPAGGVKPREVKPAIPAPFNPNDLIAYESFEPTTVGDWSGNWVVQEPGATGSFRRTFGLQHAAAEKGEAGDARMLIGRVSVSKLLPSVIRADADGVYFFSFLVRTEKPSPAGEPCDVQLSFHNTGMPDPRQKLSTRLSWSKNGVSISWEEASGQVSIPLELNRVYVVVGKLALSGERTDQAFVRLFSGKQPLPLSEPADWTVTCPPVKSSAHFNAVEWSSANVHGIAVDELRLGRTWPAVVAPYQVSNEAAAPKGKSAPPQN